MCNFRPICYFLGPICYFSGPICYRCARNILILIHYLSLNIRTLEQERRYALFFKILGVVLVKIESVAPRFNEELTESFPIMEVDQAFLCFGIEEHCGTDRAFLPEVSEG